MNQILEFLKSPTGNKLIAIVVAMAVIFLATVVIKRFVIMRYVHDSGSKYRVRKFVNFFAYLLLALIALLLFSKQLSGITIFLSVAGAGIAFALQEVIVSIAGFIAIHSSGFYKIGDRVLLGGIKGDVIDIGVLRTTVMEIGDWVKGDQYNGRMVRIANSFVFKEPVFNYSGDFPFLWDEITIPIKHTSDHHFARKVFYDILLEVQGDYSKEALRDWNLMMNKYALENARVDPKIMMMFDANWITFTLRYVVDYKKRRSTKDVLFDRILEAIRASEDKIQVASAALEVTNVPAHSDKSAG